jgi:hypothetical protein
MRRFSSYILLLGTYNEKQELWMGIIILHPIPDM